MLDANELIELRDITVSSESRALILMAQLTVGARLHRVILTDN